MALASFDVLYKGIAEAVSNVDDNMPFLLKGAPFPELKDKEEWVAFELIAKPTYASNMTSVDEKVICQITCYPLHAEFRQDGNWMRPYTLAEMYINAFSQKSTLIENTCVKWKEPDSHYVDIRSLADFAKQIYQNSPPMQVHAVVIILEGLIIQSRS